MWRIYVHGEGVGSCCQVEGFKGGNYPNLSSESKRSYTGNQEAKGWQQNHGIMTRSCDTIQQGNGGRA